MIRIIQRVVLILCSTTLVAHAAVQDAGAKVDWGYVGNVGPANWAQLSPAFSLCASGTQQAPINIPEKIKSGHQSLSLLYQPSVAWIIDDGLTTLELGKQKTIINDGHGVQVNFHASSLPERVKFAGENYRLVQFHFHTPSETQWHKESFPLEIHFVHQGKNGKALVIAVLAKGGESNATIQNIIDNLPAEDAKEQKITSGLINPINLFPINKQKFYNFQGSLTTPPCTEGIQWVVLTDTITVSPAQIVTLRKAMDGSNARPVQPLNKRKVYLVEG